MEKYFVIEISKTINSEVYATLVTVKDTFIEAKMLFHQTMASLYANANLEHAIVKIDNYDGNTIAIESI